MFTTGPNTFVMVLTGPKTLVSLWSQQDQLLNHGPDRTKNLFFIVVLTGPITSSWS